MTPTLLALAVSLALSTGAALAYAVRRDDHLDRELRALDRRPCPHDCTACSTTRKDNGR